MRERRRPPASVLTDSACPAAGCAGHLAQKGADAKREAAQLPDGAANVNRLHLLVLTGPDQSMPHQLLGIIGNWHSAQATDDHLLAVGDTDDLFPFQTKEQQVDHFTPGMAAVLSAPAV